VAQEGFGILQDDIGAIALRSAAPLDRDVIEVATRVAGAGGGGIFKVDAAPIGIGDTRKFDALRGISDGIEGSGSVPADIEAQITPEF
jgi:hypothetical protein